MARIIDGQTFMDELGPRKPKFSINKELLDEMRQAISIVTLLEDEYHVILEEGDNGWYQACCPLPGHRDMNPSFGANAEKGIFNCFACSRKGDHYDLIRIMECFSFPKAVERMMLITGITDDGETDGVRRAVRDISGLVGEYFMRQAETVLPGGMGEVGYMLTLAQRLRDYEVRSAHDPAEIVWVDSVYERADRLEENGDLLGLARLWDGLSKEIKTRLIAKQEQL